jgi:hypothetical protein
LPPFLALASGTTFVGLEGCTAAVHNRAVEEANNKVDISLEPKSRVQNSSMKRRKA